MAGKGVVIGQKELVEKFKKLNAAVQGEALKHVVRAGADVVVNAAKENIKAQGLVRTRTLSRSIHAEVTESTDTHAAAEIGTNLEYAAIHEFGGTVRAKRSKYLAIPVGTRRGSPLKHADLSVRKTAGGNLVMTDPGGTVQYVLKRSVEIPARPYLRPAADEHRAEIGKAMADGFRQVVEKAAE